MSYRIIHITDLHLTHDKNPIWGVNTCQNFEKALQNISHLTDIKCIIVTGDIANDGNIKTYEYADKLFEELGIPTLWCPGNHDSLDVLHKTFQAHFVLIEKSITIGNWKILALNSVALDADNLTTNRSRGILESDVFDEIEALAYCYPEANIALAMHHPSIEIGSWLDEKILCNRKEFNVMIQTHPNIRLVMSGHIHVQDEKHLGNIAFSLAPSCGFGFKKELPKFQIDPHTEGFNLIELNENGSVIIKNILI